MDHVEGGVRVSRGLAALPGPEDAHNSACSAGRPQQLRDPDKSPSPAASELTGYGFLPRNQLPLGPDAVPEVPPAHCPLEPSPAAECTPSRDCAPSLPLPCLRVGTLPTVSPLSQPHPPTLIPEGADPPDPTVVFVPDPCLLCPACTVHIAKGYLPRILLGSARVTALPQSAWIRRFLNDAIYLGRCSNCWFLTAEWGLERVLVFPPVYFIVSH